MDARRLKHLDREDQLDLFKLHLPYVWRAPAEVDTLFLPPINRPGFMFTVLTGLVESDWYAHPVNLVLRKPAAGLFERTLVVNLCGVPVRSMGSRGDLPEQAGPAETLRRFEPGSRSANDRSQV